MKQRVRTSGNDVRMGKGMHRLSHNRPCAAESVPPAKTVQALVLQKDNLLYGIAVQQRPAASPVTQPCALGTRLTHGDNATSGPSVSLPGR